MISVAGMTIGFILYICVCVYIYTYIYIVVANRGYSLGVVHRLFITVASLVEQRL